MKLAKHVPVGAEIRLTVGAQDQVVSVVSIVESVQVLRRPALIFTVQGTNGRPMHRTFSPNSPVRIVGGS